ncbi:hypothetical protein [Rhodoplanes roseus]|uniref:ASCH domain-containing protein n=1 Tax=Rhodoplanes roseus TaxID=29409 RepID=A0A327KP35_9BRAD|nr:hypothetical protein [Rhodoplanes roseus]RAI39092.1 hypothetical protein CH341_26580 [Rhodoplanes roseus]
MSHSLVMKALTVWQPWASLIAILAKPYEFRGRRPPPALIGQRIAIHAGARKPRPAEVKDLIDRLETGGGTPPCLVADIALPFLRRVYEGLTAPAPDSLFGEGSPAPFALPLSAIVCTAVLGEPKAGDACGREFGWSNDSDRDGTFNWGWPMQDVRPLVPAPPARGAQGFWNWQETAA